VLGAGQRPHPLIAAVPRDNPGERAPRQKIHQWAKSVLPLFTSASSEIFRKVPDRVQIDTTLNRQNPVQNHAVTGRRSGLNRTAVF
jgi:hypothetical protein